MGDLGSTPGLGRSPGEGKVYPLQYSGLENSMDCIVHGVAKSWKRYVYQNIFLMFPQITDVIIWAFCFVLFQSCCLAFPFLEGWFSKMCFLKLSLVHSPLPFTLYYLICMLKSEEHSPPFSFTTPCKTYSLRNMP